MSNKFSIQMMEEPMYNDKQTVVEWLQEEITYDNGDGQRWGSFKETVDLTEYFEQAKKTHKEEHAKTWDDAMENMKARGGNDMRAWTDFDEYYNETFGGNK